MNKATTQLEETIVVLEWTFTPADYFEDEIRIHRKEYEMVIGGGKVEAKIAPQVYDGNPAMRDELHNALNARFLGVQMFSHKPYDLSKPSLSRLHPDGRRDVTVFVNPVNIKFTVNPVDFIARDKDGNVISDTKRERIEKKNQLADLAEKYRDNDMTAASMLNSYNSAVNDPDNELVHLYEIRDALAKKLGGKTTTLRRLGISEPTWNRLGSLANTEPLKQGRHRGSHSDHLRDATEAELNEARSIARLLIETYFAYLENENADPV
ncbi:MAG: hypothetical protein IPM53_18160 [Anaerolineaceae bacterium]|nr:hypothetical protein [Anaerolineaceae bacterium]